MAEQVEVTFTRAKDYRIVPANGAWGGISPQGEIIIDLYIESLENPKQLILEVEEGKPPKEVKRSKTIFVRESQVGIVLRPDIAYSIGQFLIDRARQAGFKPEPQS